MTDIYMFFYMVFHSKADSIEANCRLASVKRFILYTVATENRVCILCIWLHLRDNLKLQCSVDICVMLLSS